MQLELFNNYAFNLNKIAKEDLCYQAYIFCFIEDENGINVFEINVSFSDKFNTFIVHEQINCYEIDDGEFIANDCKEIGENKEFCIHDYFPDSKDLNIDDTYKEADKRRDTALMQYLEKRFQELKTLEENGELKNYLIKNGYTEPQIEENIQQNQQSKSKRRKQ